MEPEELSTHGLSTPTAGCAESVVDPTTVDRRARPRRWVLHDDLAVTLRQVRSDDAAALQAMLLRQSRATRYFRFHNELRALTDLQLARLTSTASPLELGLVLALDCPGRERVLVAEARFASEDGVSGEVAVVVDEAWRRRGLCLTLFDGLLAGARRAGLSYLHGRVLDTNESMLRLAQRAGWTMSRDAEDRRVRCFRIGLGGASE